MTILPPGPPEVWPLVDEGCMFTGNATRAEAEPMSLSPGTSAVKPDKPGWTLLNKLGVVRDMTGVVRESVLTVTAGSMWEVVAKATDVWTSGELSSDEGASSGSSCSAEGGGEEGI